MRPIATACALVVLLTAAAFAYANLAGTPGLTKAPKKQKAITISGHVDNLLPGVPNTLNVKVRNNLKHQIKLSSLKVMVGDASQACPRTMLTTGRVKAKTKLKARKSLTIPVTVTLAATAPDACQSAKFPIKYRAKAQLRQGAH